MGRGGHSRAGVTRRPASTLPPAGARQSAAEASLPSGAVTCVPSVLEAERRERRDRPAASGLCARACLGIEMSTQQRGDAGRAG